MTNSEFFIWEQYRRYRVSFDYLKHVFINVHDLLIDTKSLHKLQFLSGFFLSIGNVEVIA